MSQPKSRRDSIYAICPYCGNKHADMWDHSWGASDEIEITCYRCDRDFKVLRHVDVEYETRPLEDQGGGK